MMAAAVVPQLTHWTNFYVIVGSSGGALTGLQFVVMTLIAESQIAGGMKEIRAFGTPTVVQFCAALLISAIMSAPWYALSDAGICLGAFGGAGFVYSLVVLQHARKQRGYSPDGWDWFWYTVLPLIAYAILTTASIMLPWWPGLCLLAIAVISLQFLFVGIRNSWDTVTYIAVAREKLERRRIFSSVRRGERRAWIWKGISRPARPLRSSACCECL